MQKAKPVLFITLFFVSVFLFATISSYGRKLNYADYVNVFLGTGGHGHTFPGATLPHGMVQLSPDTRLSGWDGCSGYHYSDSSIIGFSHTHLSGVGIGDYGDILFMPFTGVEKLRYGTEENPDAGYRSRFSHSNETGRPGYYQVFLLDDSINVELTATDRAGFHRYTYPKGENARLIIDMEPTIHNHQHPETEITIVNDSTIEGMKYTKGWARNHYVYFYAVFSKPFSYTLYNDTNSIGEGKSVIAKTSKAVLNFKLQKSENTVLAKVGISSVDKEGAKKNLTAEIPNWEFDQIAENAYKTWNEELNKIEIKSKDKNDLAIFYTSLYHTAINPSLASDVDGRYRTMNHDIALDKNYKNYTVFSLWDTYRALHPLYTIIKPEKNQEFIKALLHKYDEGGLLPKWELASNETGTMIGYHAVSVIVDAYMKDQCDFDKQKALEACMRSSIYDTTGVSSMIPKDILHEKMMPPALKYKNEQGYIPSDKCKKSVAQGLEFAYNDWLIAQFARSLGKPEIYSKYQKLSKNYMNYFDDSTKLMRGRLSNGAWVSPFDPVSLGYSTDYVEGNAWQWSWFVPQDIAGLTSLMGGRAAFEARLDSLFTMSSKLTGDPNAAADVTGLIGQYAHGNEPSHHIAYLYNYADKPWKTEQLVDKIMHEFYSNKPDGISGNEDCGQMSAWYILSSLGFYPVCPGNPVYSIGRPLFDEAIIHLPNNKTFTIRTQNNSPKNKFVKEIKLNNNKISNFEITHQAIMAGGLLEFTMDDKPLH